MSGQQKHGNLFSGRHDPSGTAAEPAHRLFIVMTTALGGFHFEWRRLNSEAIIAAGLLLPSKLTVSAGHALDWTFEMGGGQQTDGCSSAPQSVSALMKRIRRLLPLAPDEVHLAFQLDTAYHAFQPGHSYGLALPSGREWALLTRLGRDFARVVEALSPETPVDQRGRSALLTILQRNLQPVQQLAETGRPRLQVTLNMVAGLIQLDWTDASGARVATGRVTCTGLGVLTWELTTDGPPEKSLSKPHLNSIRAQLRHWNLRFPVANQNVSSRSVIPSRSGNEVVGAETPFMPSDSPWLWLEENVQAMAEHLRVRFTPLGQMMDEIDPLAAAEFERYEHRLLRKEQRRAEEEWKRQETMRRLAEERRRREHHAEARRQAATKSESQPAAAAKTPVPARAPLPPLPLRIELPPLAFQETAFPLTDLRTWFLRERAARWWVSNQSDDLLALPYCRIQRFDYQVRSALRVLGPLRGRALLSDEVGLGKTIEAGLVLKEWLTRGMVKRFLVLTVPSLVDQWEEELSDKFNLATVTTNHAVARSDAAHFWRENPGIIASLHTLKQPAHLELACTVKWDVVIVDEAHYLRNRESQAWQAVNVLPRQFLLLLTATPVQNSLEELYNLVTLLQPGQLPTPREFRARFIDPKRPRQPKEPEELRRLLGQVMIRNTRANAGIHLPPRRAETVLFTPDENERGFWESWETELRSQLGDMPAGQASLWGRLLLQAAGSSPAAWRGSLEKFPNRATARAWRERAPLESSWRKKCELLPPLTRAQGGLVIFTQFLETQAAIAESLRDARVDTFLINGATPAVQRQPITEEFHKRGGALLLTHSGTEGRNLQFCHRLVNFDLPWNPMEIEQRIGRLHRLGQQHPVRIYNLVQAGTLQEHLLQILQEKLNLFELVVGETGLVLGERFSSDEFAEEVFRRWRESDGRVGEALQSLGDELAAARGGYEEIKQLDETLFAKDYESL